MKSAYIQASVAALAGSAAAFPAVADGLSKGSLKGSNPLHKRQGVPDQTVIFDPKLQYVENTGDHAFIAPDFKGGDVRGPCPGLNAAANHGYLPRNGVANHLQFIQGTHQVFGMATDLAGFLTVLGATVDGDGLSWSIGGPSQALPGNLLLGQPQGISGSHNKYECDVSPGRGDLYLYGNDFSLQMNQYQELHDMAIANGDNIDLDLLHEFRSHRFDDSINTNPYFFNGPFTGVLVQAAAYTFIYRFMGNKSAEHPDGRLNTEVMNSFFGVSQNQDGSLTRNVGMERIPDNFYKRAIGDEYSIPFFNVDAVLAITKYPKFADIGGNLGKVNTFTGVSPENITGGVYNTQMLTQGNNLACFASQFVAQATPDLLKCSGVLSDVAGATSALDSQIASSLGSLNCPTLNSAITDQFNQFPGYTQVDCKSGQY